MDLFLVEHLQIGLNMLGQEERFHCVKTTRHRVGDEVWLTDGFGQLAKGHLTRASVQDAWVQVNSIEQVPAFIPAITLAVAPLKNEGRFEWLVEKAVELGVSRIVPLLTKRTEKVFLKHDRLERIITAAMKQSVKAWRPELSTAQKPEQLSFEDFDQILLAHCMEAPKKLLTQVKPADRVLLLIGPEGDFTPEEVDFFMQAGAIPISLGIHRLRTETAAIAALSMLTITQ